MRRSSMPSVTQACTNSRLRMAMTSPRTSRAMGGQVTTAMAMTMLSSEGCRMATSTIANTNEGMVWKNSVTRISTLSVRPPK